jgi:hypothetical protein
VEQETPRVSAVFAAVLSSGREHFNAQFAVAKRQYGELDPASFEDYLRRVVDPLVCATRAVSADAVGTVAQAAYDVGLELVGQRLYTGTHQHYFGTEFPELLRAYVARVVDAPLTVLGALGNALHHLGATTGGDPGRFTRDMLRLASHVPDTKTLLALGQVQAWRAGFAHFRQGALEVLDRLDGALASRAMQSSGTAEWSDQRRQLGVDPWFDPQEGKRAKPRWVGAFRGFGGLFTRPPRVTESQGQLLVQSGDGHWLLLADAFGATFHRASDVEIANASSFVHRVDARSRDTELLVRGDPIGEQPRGAITSSIEAAGTLAITFDASHAILLCPGGLLR